MIIEVNLSNNIVFIEEEILNEENFYYTDGKEKYFIAMDDSEKFSSALIKSPYMKIYKGKSYKAAEYETRISLVTGKFVDHTNNDRKKDLKITKKLKDWIAETLPKRSTVKKYKNLSVWDAMWKFIYECAKNNTNIEPHEYVELNDFLEKLYEE